MQKHKCTFSYNCFIWQYFGRCFIGLGSKKQQQHQKFNSSNKSPKEKVKYLELNSLEKLVKDAENIKEKAKKFKFWTFREFINVAEDLNLITLSKENAIDIAELRNYIHPHKELAYKESEDELYFYKYNSKEIFRKLESVLDEISGNLDKLK